MARLMLVYGGIAGLVVILINTASLHFGGGSEWLGFLVMFIAFSAIYVAIRQHRDQALGGVITFGQGLTVGLGIAAVAGVVYVLVWELYLAMTEYAFIETYIAGIIEERREAGASEDEMAAAIAETNSIREHYANPLMRLPMTFLEIFPVGVLVSLVSAAALRNHRSRKQTQGV